VEATLGNKGARSTGATTRLSTDPRSRAGAAQLRGNPPPTVDSKWPGGGKNASVAAGGVSRQQKSHEVLIAMKAK